MRLLYSAFFYLILPVVVLRKGQGGAGGQGQDESGDGHLLEHGILPVGVDGQLGEPTRRT